MRQVYGPLLWRPGRPLGWCRCSGQQGCRNLGDLGSIYHAPGFASDLPLLYLNFYLSKQVRWSCLGLYCVLLSLTVSWHIVGSLTGFFPGKPLLLSSLTSTNKFHPTNQKNKHLGNNVSELETATCQYGGGSFGTSDHSHLWYQNILFDLKTHNIMATEDFLSIV